MEAQEIIKRYRWGGVWKQKCFSAFEWLYPSSERSLWAHNAANRSFDDRGRLAWEENCWKRTWTAQQSSAELSLSSIGYSSVDCVEMEWKDNSWEVRDDDELIRSIDYRSSYDFTYYSHFIIGLRYRHFCLCLCPCPFLPLSLSVSVSVSRSRSLCLCLSDNVCLSVCLSVCRSLSMAEIYSYLSLLQYKIRSLMRDSQY